ncbi:MAG: adenylyl-sulfate kinase [Planctomycetes bacterium]|nr:adenylyl-sulfate kinase [Planctomycetota bacterium]
MFAIWITGPPASGKSTLAQALARKLRTRGTNPVVLESDELRRYFIPRPAYSEEERRHFYEGMVFLGRLFADRGVPVIFDATAHRRAYRDLARDHIPRYLEVFVDCPIEVCSARDPKGIYRMARTGEATTVPGVQVEFETPEHPDVRFRSDQEDPETAADRVVEALVLRGFLPARS